MSLPSQSVDNTALLAEKLHFPMLTSQLFRLRMFSKRKILILFADDDIKRERSYVFYLEILKWVLSTIRYQVTRCLFATGVYFREGTM